jgi:S1-C subfamily serine protease
VTDASPAVAQSSGPPPQDGRQRLIFFALLIITAGLTWRLVHLAQTAGPAGPATAAKSELGSAEQETIELFRQASPSVVFITSLERKLDRFTMNVMERPRGTGSGFVWDTQGHIVTNFHVIAEAQSMSVTLHDQSTWPARPIGVAADKDLAVLKIEAPPEVLRALPIGTSFGLAVGQTVLAIGNPFGFDQTLTTGVISGLEREIESITRRPITGVIQTDAAINPGNSGGPLLDSSGRLIGVNTAIYSPTGAYAGVGFAVPVDTIANIIPELITHGRIVRPGLGVTLVPDHMTRVPGLVIAYIAPGSGAAEAKLNGMRQDVFGRWIPSDIITAVNQTDVETQKDLFRALDGLQVGDVVTLEVQRKGATRSVKVRLQALD